MSEQNNFNAQHIPPVMPTSPPYPTYMPSRFLNFWFSLIPGAGQMYQGLMMRGVLIMACFSVCIVALAFFGNMSGAIANLFIGVAVTGIVITYAFGFFDSLHSCRLIRAGMKSLQYTSFEELPIQLPKWNLAGKGYLIIGVILTVIGALALFSTFVDRFIPRDIFYQYVRPALELALPLAFVVLGVILILKSRKVKASA